MRRIFLSAVMVTLISMSTSTLVSPLGGVTCSSGPAEASQIGKAPVKLCSVQFNRNRPRKSRRKGGKEFPKPPDNRKRPVVHPPLLDLPEKPLVKLSQTQKNLIQQKKLNKIQLSNTQIKKIENTIQKSDSEKVDKQKARKVINSLISKDGEFDVRRAVNLAEKIYNQLQNEQPQVSASVNGQSVSPVRSTSSEASTTSHRGWWTTRYGPRIPGSGYPFDCENHYSSASSDGGNTHPWGADHWSNADVDSGAVGAYIKAWTGSAWATGSQYVTFSTRKDTDIHVKALVDYRGKVKKINGLYPGSTKEIVYSSKTGWNESNITPPWTWQGVTTGIIETLAGCVPYYHIGDVVDAITTIKDIATAVKMYDESQKHGSHQSRWVEFDFSVEADEITTIGVGLRADGASVVFNTLYATAMGQILYIDIQQERYLKPRFEYSPSKPVEGQEVTFTNSSSASGSIESYTWKFGDGDTGTKKNPTHVFSEPGSYDVRLTVTDNEGSTNTLRRTIEVEPDLPEAAFEYSPDYPEPGAEVYFEDKSSGDGDAIETREWAFGNGKEGSGVNPSIQYSEEGQYTVTLTVTDEGGYTDSVSREIEVEERGGNVPPEADFSWQPYSPKVGERVNFECKAVDPDGNIKEYHWDFDDGRTSNKENPTHSFGSPEGYDVTLTVTDADGLSDERTRTVGIVTGGGIK